MLHSRTALGAALSLALTAGTAYAQHGYGGTYHYQPGHFDYHNGHYDYHPGTRTYYPDYYDGHQHGGAYSTPYRSGYRGDYGPSYGSTRHPYDHATAPRFGGFSHVDDLAAQLERDATNLCWELHYNYQHNPGYRETYRETYELMQTAKFIHGLEHSRNRDRVKKEVAELDTLFHHIHRDVANWTAHHHRQVGRGGLTQKLEQLEQTLHHLMDDVGVRSTYQDGNGSGPGNSPAPPPSLDTL